MKKSKKLKKNHIDSTYFELDELITRVLCDTAPRHKVDAAYLFGETLDLEDSVLKAGVFLYKRGPVKKLAICGMQKGYGYPGVKNWLGKLAKMGVPKKDICAIPIAHDFPPSTHAEALGLVRHAQAHGWKSVYIVAPPLHQLRAFVTAVTEASRLYPKLKLYSFHGLPQRWEDHIIHSQGILQGTRSELLADELEKIERYYRKGDLVSAEEVLRYLDKRDGNV